MRIETTRMTIRDFTPEDALDLYEILGDDETMKYSEPAYSFDRTKEFLASFCIARHGAVAAVHKKSDKLIGYILFSEQNKGVYEMGGFFNRSFWRHGYAYESCKAVIRHAFEERDAHRIFAETIDPEKSVGLMKKLGMRMEDICQNGMKDIHGNCTELYCYGMTKDEWKKQSMLE